MKTSGILFRGKRITDNEWIWGSLINDHSSGTVGIAIYAEMPKKTMFYGELKKCNIYQVNPETVGRFTGLTDKNGVRIFEGDIVYCISKLDNANCVVIFEEGEFRLVPLQYYNTYVTDGGYHAVRCFEKEVIGNIHDNLELLKGGENNG